jgi:hypothetical protein
MGKTLMDPATARRFKEDLSNYLREFRASNQKDEYFGQGGLLLGFREKYPHWGKLSDRRVKSEMTHILHKRGIERDAKSATTYQRYHWPLGVMV